MKLLIMILAAMLLSPAFAQPVESNDFLRMMHPRCIYPDPVNHPNKCFDIGPDPAGWKVSVLTGDGFEVAFRKVVGELDDHAINANEFDNMERATLYMSLVGANTPYGRPFCYESWNEVVRCDTDDQSQYGDWWRLEIRYASAQSALAAALKYPNNDNPLRPSHLVFDYDPDSTGVKRVDVPADCSAAASRSWLTFAFDKCAEWVQIYATLDSALSIMNDIRGLFVDAGNMHHCPAVADYRPLHDSEPGYNWSGRGVRFSANGVTLHGCDTTSLVTTK